VAVTGPGHDDATAWALAAREGDAAAAAAFIRATQADVWRLTAALGDRMVADDLTQETYLRAFRALPAFEGRASVRTWLFSIARRVCADHVRAAARRRRFEAGSGDAAAPTGLNRTANIEDATGVVDVADLLARLAPARREAFVLTQVLGLSYLEAAQAAGVPIGTIRSRVARARADLVEMLTAATSA
jgi:RNA polymerase sigma-70 factor, ECF subfamily